MYFCDGLEQRTVAMSDRTQTITGPMLAKPIWTVRSHIAKPICMIFAQSSLISLAALTMASTWALVNHTAITQVTIKLTSVLMSVTAAELSTSAVLRSVDLAKIADTKMPRSIVTVR